MNPSQKLEEKELEIKQLNEKIEEAILGVGRYKDVAKDDRTAILADLKEQREWTKRRVEAEEKKKDILIYI